MAYLQQQGVLSRLARFAKLAVQPLHKTQWKELVRQPGALALKPLSMSVPFVVDAAKLASYFSLCKLPEDPLMGQVPILYPEIVGLTVCMDLLGQPDFPFPLLGVVHAKNHVVMRRALSAQESLKLGLKVREQSRAVNRGTEVDVEMTLTDSQNTTPWEGLITFLILHQQPQGKALVKPPSAEPPLTQAQAQSTVVWNLAEDAGRKYAKVSGDYNPIHLYAMSARLLGFSRAIMHGMYTTAQAYSECVRVLGDSTCYPMVGTAQYKRPVFLPSQVELRVAKTDRGAKFDMVDPSNSKLLQNGTLTVG